MLGIGAVLGGPEVSASCFGQLETKLMNLVSDQIGEFAFGSIAALNVVFHVPGSIIKDIPYDGLRDGTFSKSRKLLMIQVSVPKVIAESTDAQLVTRFLFDSLREANRIGAKYFKGTKG